MVRFREVRRAAEREEQFRAMQRLPLSDPHPIQSAAGAYTRRGHNWTHKMKGIASALFPIQSSAVIDGEIVVVGPDGTTDFNELERELGKGDSDRLTFYAFDVPYLDGYDMRAETLLNRKQALQLLLEALPKDSPISSASMSKATPSR